MSSLVVVSVLLFAYSLVSKRIEGTVLTAPALFTAAGYLASMSPPNIFHIDVTHDTVHLIAEITLVLVLFSDAARIRIGQLRRTHNLPLRMLGIGLPLTFLLGTAIAAVLFPSFALWEAALLAALLAPTDAALGQSVVCMRTIPLRIRQTINVESGLNDGIALPVVLMLATYSNAMVEQSSLQSWVWYAVGQLLLGPVAGIIVGLAGARLLDHAASRGWASIPLEGVATLSLAALAYVGAEAIGGNGFIASFVAGAAFGSTLRTNSIFLFDFMESEGSLLMLITFLVFGASLLPEALAGMQPMYLVYALLSLTVIRMLPIGVSLIGSGIRPATWLFLGWFGPRGLASILFLLLIFDHQNMIHRNALFSITVLTVGLSIFLHGLSAAPFSRWYGRYVDPLATAAEKSDVHDFPLRDGSIDPR